VPERIQRVGATVRRPLAPWSPAVHGLLRHLEAAAFPAPRVVRTEGDSEVLSWIEGESYLEELQARIGWTESARV
jgi:hypothetical protein